MQTIEADFFVVNSAIEWYGTVLHGTLSLLRFILSVVA